MPNRSRPSELALALIFLALLFMAPTTQTLLELRRGERVQATDVFRTRPTAAHLRQYEQTLEEKSWVQREMRPDTQRLLFALARDAGSKAVVGLNDWFFYRPDVRYLIEPNRVEADNSNSQWMTPAESLSQREVVFRTIVRFRNQLKERGIELLVVPVPGKPGVYPEQVTRRAAGRADRFRSPTLELLSQLQSAGIATVDLFSLFREHRRAHPEAPLYLARDTHWTPLGAQLAAQAVAHRLFALQWSQPGKKEFATQPQQVFRHGDILGITQVPGLAEAYPPERVICEQVRDSKLGLMVPSASDRPGTYRFPGQKSSVLVLGDSFSRIYQYAEPASLGKMDSPEVDRPGQTGTKRLLPGSAGFIAHLAKELKAPVDAIVSDGGASTDVRRKLSINPEILEQKTVVIWEFVERDIGLGKTGWEEVPLPPRLDS